MDGEQRCAVMLLTQHATRLRRTFLLAPYGPVLDPALDPTTRTAVWRELLKGVEQSRSSATMFLKVEPNAAPPDGLPLEPGTGMEPERTLLVDLRKTGDELLAGMHQKTRYNIRLAEKKQIEVRWGSDEATLETFYRLSKLTATRQNIGIHPIAHYRAILRGMGSGAEIALASLGTEPLATGLFLRFGDAFTYQHGGSADERKELMAPHLLQWRAIQRAKQEGYRWYDFYGIAPEDATNHNWAGITRFKLGFGGERKDYPGAFNLVYQRNWYLAYRFAKRLRSL